MSVDMKIAAVQMDIKARDVAENLRRADALIDAHPGADVYVLPEMFSTGFDMEPDVAAEPEGGASLQWMRRKAAETGAVICGSVATAVELFTYTNRMYFVTPEGEVTAYDKHHLFTYSGENNAYTPGTERVVAEWRGVRFLLEVCYDLRFPVWSRCRDDYDVMLYVADWPVKRRVAWDVLLQARALENQCFVCGANRVGTDRLDCVYNGGSVIIGPYGDIMATAPDNAETIVMAEIDMQRLRDFRAKFPVSADADPFTLGEGQESDGKGL